MGRQHFFRKIMHIFIKIIKQSRLKIENGFKIMLDASKYRQRGVGYIKMSSKLWRIHFQSRSRKPPVTIIYIFATFLELQLGRLGGDKRGTERTTER